jgi:histone acetyltransferase (RNA polymerase elongator complex component)
MRVVPVDLGGSLSPCAIAPPPRATPCAQTIDLLIKEKKERFPQDNLCVAFFHGRIPNEEQLAACAGLPVRLSLNPADMSPELATRLQAAGADIVELEAMTFSPHALRASQRPYTVMRVESMAKKLKAMGFKLGLHLVPGLPGSDVGDALDDATAACSAGWVDHVRIWPALAFQGAVLADWAKEGRWRPWDVRQAVDVVDQMTATFDAAGIPVVRIGIQPGQDIPVRAVAGPLHPNLRGEIQSRRFGYRIRKALEGVSAGANVTIAVNGKDLAWAKGTSNINGRTSRALYQLEAIEFVADESVQRGTVSLRRNG